MSVLSVAGLRRVRTRHRVARLRVAALRYAGNGWPVLPVQDDDSTEPGAGAGVVCAGRYPTTDTATVSRWWDRIPYRIGLGCGEVADVISAPAALGAAAHRVLLRSTATATTAADRWLFVVTAGVRLPDRLTAAGVLRHGPGEWVALPPTSWPSGPTYWLVEPQVVQWEPARAEVVHGVLVNALLMSSATRLPGMRGVSWL
ncbi:bifunctional DNA primase/polymerase [Fodinicola feengrottensis]|uniref:Bifunctional DNA primase/polymerase n=1 Tax=Fodinicola feengrottensis TaxID=435914 RepID=A0ABN2HS82_9ACTN